MAHNLNIMNDGRASLAFRGDRNDIWHRLGQEVQPGWSLEDWAANSGLNWEAHKVPAYADLAALGLDAFTGKGLLGHVRVEERHFIARGDNGYILSPQAVSDRYQLVQPRAALDFCQHFISADPRFALDTAMCLKSGEIIAVTAVFNGDTKVAGENHRARLLMTTTFDGSGATIGKGLMTRVMCNNTLSAGLSEKGCPVISTRHNSHFDPEKVASQLSMVATQFKKYQALGDAMAAKRFATDEVSRFFKLTLDIDPKDKREDISTKKWNQFEELVGAYQVGTRKEGLEPNTAWAMLQGVTRYADHNKSVKHGGDPSAVMERRFVQANLPGGTGLAMKEHAVQLLDEMSNGDLLHAVAVATAARKDDDDIARLLKQPLRPATERN